MGILFFVNEIAGPSHLWARRMLSGLGNNVATLVTEVSPGPRSSENYEVVVIREGASILVSRLRHRLGLTASVRRSSSAIGSLVKAIRSDRVQVVLIHYLTSAVMYDRAWSQTDKAVFVHCHGWDVTWDLRDPNNPQSRVHDSDYVDRIRALPDHVKFIANSKKTVERLRDIDIPANRIYLKYLGVEVPSTSPVSQRQQAGELTILYLGRLVDAKGPDLVIKAFDLACEHGLEARLKIAGFGPLYRKCEAARAKSLFCDRIELLGAVDAAAGTRLRRSSHIFTAHNQTGPQSGQEEAFGVAFVEAMADGLPIVTGRSGAIPEIIEDGRQGVLVQPGDVDAHAEALLNLGRNPELRMTMGRSGWERARELFSTEQEISRLLEILELEPNNDTERRSRANIRGPRGEGREHITDPAGFIAGVGASAVKATVKRSIDIGARVLPDWLLRKAVGRGFVAPFYHLVSDEPVPHVGYPFKTLREFEADLEFFLAQFRPVGLADIRSSLDLDQSLPTNAFFLSFDDGLREIYDVVAPVLVKKGVPATFFLATHFLDNRDLFYKSKAVLLSAAVDGVNDPRLVKDTSDILTDIGICGGTLREQILAIPYGSRGVLDQIAPRFDVNFTEVLTKRKPYLESAQIRELLASGFTVGAHSLDHPHYPSLDLDEQMRQTQESVSFMCEHFQVDCKAFAIPFGALGSPPQKFYDAVMSDGTVDVMFGTSARQDSRYPRCVQRLEMESPAKNVSASVFAEHLKCRLRSLLG